MHQKTATIVTSSLRFSHYFYNNSNVTISSPVQADFPSLQVLHSWRWPCSNCLSRRNFLFTTFVTIASNITNTAESLSHTINYQTRRARMESNSTASSILNIRKYHRRSPISASRILNSPEFRSRHHCWIPQYTQTVSNKSNIHRIIHAPLQNRRPIFTWLTSNKQASNHLQSSATSPVRLHYPSLSLLRQRRKSRRPNNYYRTNLVWGTYTCLARPHSPRSIIRNLPFIGHSTNQAIRHLLALP